MRGCDSANSCRPTLDAPARASHRLHTRLIHRLLLLLLALLFLLCLLFVLSLVRRLTHTRQPSFSPSRPFRSLSIPPPRVRFVFRSIFASCAASRCRVRVYRKLVRSGRAFAREPPLNERATRNSRPIKNASHRPFNYLNCTVWRSLFTTPSPLSNHEFRT